MPRRRTPVEPYTPRDLSSTGAPCVCEEYGVEVRSGYVGPFPPQASDEQ